MTTKLERKELRQVALIQVLVGLAILGVWWFQTREGRVSPLMLPPPEDVARTIPDLLQDSTFWTALRVTALEMVGAFLVAGIAGVVVGSLLGASRYAAKVASPILVWCQTVPIILFYPLCLLFFGVGEASKIAFGGFYGFFPIAATTVMALSTVPERYRTAALAMGATKGQLIAKVLVPAARPIVASGLRLGAALCLIGVIAGEMLGAVAGLGYQIKAASAVFESANMYAYIVVTLILVGLFNLVINRADEPTI
jgi:ABC-type nitrate/sulfonate/bicarbonate transport system permease component